MEIETDLRIPVTFFTIFRNERRGSRSGAHQSVIKTGLKKKKNGIEEKQDRRNVLYGVKVFY